MPDPSSGEPAAAVVSVEFLREMSESVGAGIYVLDGVGRITSVSARAAEMLGRTVAQLEGVGAHGLFHRRRDGSRMPYAECELARVITQGRLATGTAYFLRGDGELLPVSWTSLPVHREGHRTGAAVVFTSRPRPLAGKAPEVRELTGRTAGLSMVADATTVLASTLDADKALRRLARLVVPRFAEWAVFVRLAAGLPHCVAVAGDAGGSPAPWLGPLPPVPDGSLHPLVRVLRGAPAMLLGPEDIASPPDTELAAWQEEMLRSFGTVSAIAAPLTARHQVLGSLTLGRTDPAKPFDARELALAVDLARRAGLAMDNARLFSQQRDIAETMQRHLLTDLPEHGVLQLAARYRPAAAGSQIGGDWYDAFPLPDDAMALVIGDIAGHDMQAAARMAQVRSMLRTLAWEHQEPPGLIVGRMDGALERLTDTPLATLVYARVEGPARGPWQLNWTSAGHPPPLLVSRDGSARYLDQGHGPFLGLPELVGPRTDCTEPLLPSSTLLLYTDGLVETHVDHLDAGMRRLRLQAAALARAPVGEFCDGLLARLPDVTDDDIALLAVRLPETGGSA
ncbi:GAF domain-containing protein [Streptomyces armeniacus]|uniref:protein-serine/threonine phosphatase n=1 Tax=Streptomyces armeniacus TaxID=83291 RepID=A0A345XIE9_9ACTN|nr:SpoIIE family protein phosphatase [Streptomyces armeniacus]AXK31415.1 GAF domain-containing protein [Streptomyces armeniacus]